MIISEKDLDSTSVELNNISTWAESNNLKLNLNKTKEIIFRRRRNVTEIPLIDNYNIQRVESINILGVKLSHKLSFSEHVDTILKKSHAMLYMCRVLKNHGLNQKDLHNVYNSFIISRVIRTLSKPGGDLPARKRSYASRAF